MKIHLSSVSGEAAIVEVEHGRISELTEKVFEHFLSSETDGLAHFVLRFLRAGSVLDDTEQLDDGDEVTFLRQELPHVRFIEGQEHWTEEIAPQLEEQEVAALITTRACGPADRVTRQCVKCAHDYKIHFCRSPDVSTAERTVEVQKEYIAIIHRKTGGESPEPGVQIDSGVSFEMQEGKVLCRLLFEGGFPNGGECWADIHAPWGTCFTSIPPRGCLILEIPWA